MSMSHKFTPMLGLLTCLSSAMVSADGGNNRLTATPNAAYQKECGSCHFAYPAALLPARSWQALMGGLDKHFDENAELDAQVAQEITQYLNTEAGDNSKQRIAYKFMKSLAKDSTPLRISDVPYFRKEHREVPKKVFENNPKLSSISQCGACHTKAAEGDYAERNIHIPGFGAWND